MSQPIDWRRAVSALTSERERAVAAVGIIRSRGTPAQIDAARLDYSEGRAEAGAVIGALLVALEEGSAGDPPPDLERRMEIAIAARIRLGAAATALIGPQVGERSILGDLAKELIAPISDAISALWNAARDDAARKRTTVAGLLAAARWPEFDAETGG
jgi:hypothetical protein